MSNAAELTEVRTELQACPLIVSEGHRYWIDKDGKDHITFYNNPLGRKLKGMWKQLHKPIKQQALAK